MLDTQTAVMEARECRADAQLLRDDKRYYQAKLADLARELAAEKAKSAAKDKLI
jgi:hypothetical protein